MRWLNAWRFVFKIPIKIENESIFFCHGDSNPNRSCMILFLAFDAFIGRSKKKKEEIQSFRCIKRNFQTPSKLEIEQYIGLWLKC